MDMSNIIPHKESVSSISSPAMYVTFCIFHDTWFEPNHFVHPGERFNITLIAMDQAGSPVTANILITNSDHKYYLHPLSQSLPNASCNYVYYRLYSSEEDKLVRFKLYQESPCQNTIRINSIDLKVYIKRCPLGFELPEGGNSCICNKKVQKFTQNCYRQQCH